TQGRGVGDFALHSDAQSGERMNFADKAKRQICPKPQDKSVPGHRTNLSTKPIEDRTYRRRTYRSLSGARSSSVTLVKRKKVFRKVGLESPQSEPTANP